MEWPRKASIVMFTVGFDFQNTPITTGTFNSRTGAALAEREENATTAGIYALEEFNLLPNLLLNLGGRYDNIRFSQEDVSKATGKASRTFEQFTPKVGIKYRPLPTISLYANYSEGFETPIIGELRTLPGGVFGFNKNLNPQTSKNYEIGTRGQPWEWLTFELALFRQDIRDFISPFGTFPDNSFQNVAKVRQFGVELGSEVRILPTLTLALAYTFSDFTFDRFFDGVNNFCGNRLPGVPEHSLFTELRYRHPRGFYGAVEIQYVSDFFINNANTVTNDPYTVANLRLGYEGQIGKLWFSPFRSINNLFDERYSAFARINDVLGRIFNPLPGVNAFGGIKLTR